MLVGLVGAQTVEERALKSIDQKPMKERARVPVSFTALLLRTAAAAPARPRLPHTNGRIPRSGDQP